MLLGGVKRPRTLINPVARGEPFNHADRVFDDKFERAGKLKTDPYVKERESYTADILGCVLMQ